MFLSLTAEINKLNDKLIEIKSDWKKRIKLQSIGLTNSSMVGTSCLSCLLKLETIPEKTTSLLRPSTNCSDVVVMLLWRPGPSYLFFFKESRSIRIHQSYAIFQVLDKFYLISVNESRTFCPRRLIMFFFAKISKTHIQKIPSRKLKKRVFNIIFKLWSII